MYLLATILDLGTIPLMSDTVSVNLLLIHRLKLTVHSQR